MMERKKHLLKVEGEEKERLVRVEMNVGNIVAEYDLLQALVENHHGGKLPSKKITPVEGDEQDQ